MPPVSQMNKPCHAEENARRSQPDGTFFGWKEILIVLESALEAKKI